MYTFRIFIFLSILSAQVWAQAPNATIKTGPPIQLTNKNAFYDIELIGQDKTHFYAYQLPWSVAAVISIGGLRDHSIARYDNQSLADPLVVPIELKYEGKEREFQFVTMMDGELWVFTSFQNNDHKKNYLFAEQLDKTTLLPKKGLKKVAEIDFSNESRYSVMRFTHRKSEDESKLLIQYSLIGKDNMLLSGGLTIFNSKMEHLWTFNGKLPYEGTGVFNYQEILVDNNGHAYILGKTYDSKKSLRNNQKMKKKYGIFGPRMVKREAVYKHLLFSISPKGNVLTYNFPNTDHFITDLTLAISPKQDVLALGLYAKPDQVSVMGSCYFYISKGSKSINESKFQPFDNEFLTRGMSEKEKSKLLNKKAANKEFDTNQYTLHDVVFYKDGSFTFLAEPYYADYVVKGSPQTGYYTVYRYHDKDIWVLKHSPKGDIMWRSKVIKKQMTEDAGRYYASFAHSLNGNTLTFVYNIIPRGLLSEYGNVRKAGLFQSVVSADGKVDTRTLINFKNPEGSFETLNHVKGPTNNILIFGKHKRIYHFIDIKAEK